MPTIQHMVVVKFKPQVPNHDIDAVMDQLRKFWATVEGITYFAGGAYSSPEGLNQGYTHGFLVTFSSAAGRDAYLVHPEHQRLVSQILPKLDGVMAFDFEAPGGRAG
jgi:hypothetical protein